MLKIFIVYDSKYGNTKLAGERILEGINAVGGVETGIGYVKDVEVGKVADFDVIVLGTPNHMGSPSLTMKRFVDRLVELDVKVKDVAVFGTYAGKERMIDRAVKKLEKMVEKKLHSRNLFSPGLSIRVKGIPGPIVEGELPKCLDFGKKIARQFRHQ